MSSFGLQSIDVLRNAVISDSLPIDLGGCDGMTPYCGVFYY